jgi:hypothetical protein
LDKINPEIIQRLWEGLQLLKDELPLERVVFDGIFRRCHVWPKSGHPTFVNPFADAVSKRFAPLKPLIGIQSPPHFYSKQDPVLTLSLVASLVPADMPFGYAFFENGRRMLDIYYLMLDTADACTKHVSLDGFVNNADLSASSRRLIGRMIRTFPSLDDKGERVRERCLSEFTASTPS